MNSDLTPPFPGNAFKRELAQRLQRLRLAWGMKASAFATHLGVTKSLLHKYESGQASPGAEVLLKFSQSGVNLNWLISGSGEMQWTASPPLAMEELVAQAVDVVEAVLPLELGTDSVLRGFLTSTAFLLVQQGLPIALLPELLGKLVAAYQIWQQRMPGVNEQEWGILKKMRAANPAQKKLLEAMLHAIECNEVEGQEGID